MGQILYILSEISLAEQEEVQHAQCAPARTLRVVTMVTVTRLVWASPLRVAADVFVARFA